MKIFLKEIDIYAYVPLRRYLIYVKQKGSCRSEENNSRGRLDFNGHLFKLKM